MGEESKKFADPAYHVDHVDPVDPADPADLLLEKSLLEDRIQLAAQRHADSLVLQSNFEVPELWRRFLAALIDLSILAIFCSYFLVFLSHLDIWGEQQGITPFKAPEVPVELLLCYVGGCLCIILGQILFACKNNGVSLGKAVCGLMVISKRTLTPLHPIQCFKREVFGKFLNLLMLGIGLVPILWRKDGCTLYDLWVDGQVVMLKIPQRN